MTHIIRVVEAANLIQTVNSMDHVAYRNMIRLKKLQLQLITPGTNNMSRIITLFVCVEASRPSQQFFSHVGTEPQLHVYYQFFRGVKCLAEGHNTAEVGFEPQIFRSGVQRSTTEPHCSPAESCKACPTRTGCTVIHVE